MGARRGDLRRTAFAVAITASSLAVGLALAQAGGRPGRGGGAHGPAEMGGGGRHADMQTIHFLFEHRAEIRRTVKDVPGGVETVTESDDPAVAARLRAHVEAMYRRLEEGRPIHARDPLFAELFRRARDITMQVQHTPEGLKVTETAADPEVTSLIRRHARVVTSFLENGHAEMMRDHR